MRQERGHEDETRSTDEVIVKLAAIEEWLRENRKRLSRTNERRLMESIETLVLAFRN